MRKGVGVAKTPILLPSKTLGIAGAARKIDQVEASIVIRLNKRSGSAGDGIKNVGQVGWCISCRENGGLVGLRQEERGSGLVTTERFGRNDDSV